jgi:predicted AlkP superfamily pyrophosphatase or phosphodiesterase
MKLLVVDCAALGWNLVSAQPAQSGFTFQPADPVFPAVTCTAQASFRTVSPPDRHGMIGNGLFFPETRKVLFWEQAAALVKGERLWRGARAAGKKVGMMFWQQSLGEDVDLVLSPKPIHKHEGGMIQDCYSQPHDLYDRLCEKIGRRFNLMHYWGPLASHKSSAWIVDATRAVMESPELAPDLLFSYLPHLDYDLQRHGPQSPQAARALEILCGYLAELRDAATRAGYDWLFFGDYAIEPVTAPAVFPNRALRDAGLFRVRTVKGMAYPDFFTSEAFAVADHAVAHVYAKDEATARRAREVLAGVAGIGAMDIQGSRLVLTAAPGTWFAYPWWTDRREAPDFATHVDIHNKPGYDPCELFFGWPPLSVSLDTTKVRGTHGAVGPGREIAWASSLRFAAQPRSLLDLASGVKAFFS